ncbi:DUF559 domain-containing protein [Terrabacter sp. GCM10028922]|uniref:DUF559 domain-containing protein n=1 Tax=Terrabacter sp. GCM10028922 TaxID=3273428 RepID=UPI0036140B34
MDLTTIARNDVFSAADAGRWGVSADALARLVTEGSLVPLVRGYYATRKPRDERDRHALRSMAAFRRLGGRALVSHHSTLVLQGLPTYAADLDLVHLTHRTRRSDKRSGGVHVARALPCLPGGDRVPTAVAIVQAGLVGSPLTALVAADAALHRAMVTPDELVCALARFGGHRGVGEVRAALHHADSRIESVGESLLAHTLRLLDITVTPQVHVATDSGVYRADFAVDGTRVLVEFDGRVKYDSPKVLFDEKRREDALRRAGWVVVRFVWADLRHPHRIRRRIDEAVTLSRRAG